VGGVLRLLSDQRAGFWREVVLHQLAAAVAARDEVRAFQRAA
jgi:hypothetical protein